MVKRGRSGKAPVKKTEGSSGSNKFTTRSSRKNSASSRRLNSDKDASNELNRSCTRASSHFPDDVSKSSAKSKNKNAIDVKKCSIKDKVPSTVKVETTARRCSSRISGAKRLFSMLEEDISTNRPVKKDSAVDQNPEEEEEGTGSSKVECSESKKIRRSPKKTNKIIEKVDDKIKPAVGKNMNSIEKRVPYVKLENINSLTYKIGEDDMIKKSVPSTTCSQESGRGTKGSDGDDSSNIPATSNVVSESGGAPISVPDGPKKCGNSDSDDNDTSEKPSDKSSSDKNTGTGPLFSRKFISNRNLSRKSDGSQESGRGNIRDKASSFSVASYNILADCHAQRDYTGPDCWISKDEVSMECRHKRLLEELKWLNTDVICLQEVGTKYFENVLKPDLSKFGYDGLYVARLSQKYEEGEATFYKANKFNLKCCKSLLLRDAIMAEIESQKKIEDEKLKKSLSKSIDSYAVSLLIRLESVSHGFCVSVANVHIAYDQFERQDKQCLQIAKTIRELQLMSEETDGQVICGDFNSWPLSPPHQLMNNGHLSNENISKLQEILTIETDDGKLTPLFNHVPELFHFNPAPDYKSAYQVVMDSEPYTSRFDMDNVVRQVDFIYYSTSLVIEKVLSVPEQSLIQDGVPNSTFPSDHLSIKAKFRVLTK